MSSPSTRLRPLGQSAPSLECSAIIVIVPGIGTDPVPEWKSGSILSVVQDISTNVIPYNTYCTWWDHGIPEEQILSFQPQHESAVALRGEVVNLLASLPSKLCPILFIGHSIGGLILKEALRSWNQSLSKNQAGLCVAGAVFLGTPHTYYIDRALEFCKLASLAFLNRRNSNNDYPAELKKVCRHFELMGVPIFSIYETETTRTGKFKRNILVDEGLAVFGMRSEQLWAAKCAHKELCHYRLTGEMQSALRSFILERIEAKLDGIHRTRRLSSSIKSRPSIRPMQRQDSSLFDDALVESPASSEPTSGSLSAVVNKPIEVAFPTQAAATNIPKRIQYNLPNQTERTFERHDVLKPVEELLLRFDPWQDPTSYSDRNRAFALCGGGGLGKSVSAAHFVYKHISRYDNILWISAENTNKLFFAYSEVAFKLGLADDSKPHDKFACQKEVRNWLMGLYGSKRSQNDRVQWLLVFDNVTRPEDLDGFWPSRGGGDILITTQCRQEVINRFVRVYGTEVQPFGKDVALAFLNTLTKDQIEDPGQLAHAMQIAETLGGSPLALVSLFTLLKKKRLDNELVLKVTRRRESTDSAQSRPDLSGESLDQLALLVEPLLEKLDLASSLMDVICLLDTDRIEDSILTRAAASMPLQGFPSDHLAYEAAKKELLDASLISQIGGGNGGGHGVAAQRMIRKVVQHRMSLERLQEVFEATVQMLSELWPEMTMTARHNKGRWGEIDVLLRQVRPLQHLYESTTELVLPMRASILWATLLNNAAWCMYERGDYQDATYFGDQARNIGEDLEDDDVSVGRFELPNLLSEVYYTLGAIAQITHKKRDSLELHAKMLILRKSLRHELINGDALLAHAYNEIGNDFMTEDEEYNIAVGFYQTSIRIFRSLPQEKFNKTMLSLPMANLGLAYWLQHKYQEAYELVQGALHQHEEEMGVDDGLTMKTGRLLFALGNITCSLGHYDESFEYHTRALKQFELTIGRRHNRSCDVMWRLADHYERRGEFEKALEMLNEAAENLWNRPLFEREQARLYFKKALVMKRTPGHSQRDQYQPYLDRAADIHARYRTNYKGKNDLKEEDFNGLVMFWSR